MILEFFPLSAKKKKNLVHNQFNSIIHNMQGIVTLVILTLKKICLFNIQKKMYYSSDVVLL